MRTLFVAIVAVASAGLASPNGVAAQNDLRPLDPERNPPSLSERAKGAEASIPVAVQRSIEGDRELAPYDIKVAGNERRGVTLSGTVPSARLRDRAEQLAESASGSQHVHNDIVVTAHPTDRRGDDAATTDNSDPARVMPQRE
jgi:osmotically-inducible protein OsmY